MFSKNEERKPVGEKHEKRVLSNGVEYDIRTRVESPINGSINVPEMPEFLDTSAFDILSDVGVNMRKYSDGSSGDHSGDSFGDSFGGKESYDEKSVQNIVDMISSMDEREQGIVVSVLPVELCLRRIEDELQRHMRFKDAVNEALQMN